MERIAEGGPMFSDEEDDGDEEEEEEQSMSPPKKKEQSLGKRQTPSEDPTQLIKSAMAEVE